MRALCLTLALVLLCTSAAAATEYTVCSSQHGCCNTISGACKTSDGYGAAVSFMESVPTLNFNQDGASYYEYVQVVRANDGCWYQTIITDGGNLANVWVNATQVRVVAANNGIVISTEYSVVLGQNKCTTSSNACLTPTAKILITPVDTSCETPGPSVTITQLSPAATVTSCLVPDPKAAFSFVQFIGASLGAGTEKYSICPIGAHAQAMK